MSLPQYDTFVCDRDNSVLYPTVNLKHSGTKELLALEKHPKISTFSVPRLRVCSMCIIRLRCHFQKNTDIDIFD